MAHLTLQLGAVVVVPSRTPRKTASGCAHWQVCRVLREAAAAAAASLSFGRPAPHMGGMWSIGPVPERPAHGAPSEA